MAREGTADSGRRGVKEYHYPPLRYFVTVFVANIFLIVLLVWAIHGYLTGGNDWRHSMLLLTVPVAIASSFIGLHLPTRIAVDDRGITFSAFGRSHRYEWADASDLQIRPFPFVNDRFLIRFRDRPNVFGGRYWVHSHLVGYEELKTALEAKAAQLSGTTALTVRPTRPRRRRWRGRAG